MTRSACLLVALCSLAPALVCAQGAVSTADAEPLGAHDSGFSLRAGAELGFLGVLSHEIRLGADGDTIDYRQDAGQDSLYPFMRLSLDLIIARRHIFTLLYQPLSLETGQTAVRDLRIDGLTFPAGTPLRALYVFPVYRFGWAYDLLPDERRTLAIGVGLQIRNAVIEFESRDGTLYRRRGDVGPVPLLRVDARLPLGETLWFGFLADGLYAPISFINGSDNEVEGAILDASVRLGFPVPGSSSDDLFLNLRYFGGGSTGTGDPTPTSDGSQSNWIHVLAFSLGGQIGT